MYDCREALRLGFLALPASRYATENGRLHPIMRTPRGMQKNGDAYQVQ